MFVLTAHLVCFPYCLYLQDIRFVFHIVRPHPVGGVFSVVKPNPPIIRAQLGVDLCLVDLHKYPVLEKKNVKMPIIPVILIF